VSTASPAAAGARAASASPLRKALSSVRVPQPLVLVIFGGTGDLARRKLIPALFRLWQQQLLPEGFAVVGVAREQMDDEEYRRRAREALGEFATAATDEEWADFGRAPLLRERGVRRRRGFDRLGGQLRGIEAELGSPGAASTTSPCRRRWWTRSRATWRRRGSSPFPIRRAGRGWWWRSRSGATSPRRRS
jgi:glucose-6-phosphate 1-dehydrogenase